MPRFFAILLAAALCSVAAADDEAAPNPTANTPAEPPKTQSAAPTLGFEAGDGGLSVTRHTAEIAGKPVAYTASAGLIPLKGDDGKVKASVFHVAYTVDGAEPGTRPITFCFNGGPGSSSVWLHLGMLGPKRVALPDEPVLPAPPYGLRANPFSLLDATDLVFIDPVGTGYSRPAEGEKKEQFHGYGEDIEWVGRFIQLYVTKHGRWGSPKFLCGESYGTLRAAGLAGHLRERYHMELNGIVLVSTVLDFQTIAFGESNDLPYVLFLPSYAATAWYHGRLGEDLQKKPLAQVVDEARRFALGEYATALLKGSDVPAEDRKRIAAETARLTGLSPAYVERSDLRFSMWRFGKELLRDREQSVGRFDSRYVGLEPDAEGDQTEFDPSYAAVSGPFTAALYQYLRQDLKVERDEPYEILTGKVQPWSYEEFTNKYVSAADTLAEAMTENPHLKVFVANGYYDLATPLAAAEHTFRHLDPEHRRENVTLAYYEGGHMMYVHEPSLAKLRDDLLAFYRAAVPTRAAAVRAETNVEPQGNREPIVAPR